MARYRRTFLTVVALVAVVGLVAWGFRSVWAGPARCMIGAELDSAQYLWGIWWFHAQMKTPAGLLGVTTLANYPAGAHGMIMAPFSALIAGPVLAWFGPVAAYNFAWAFNLLLMAAGVALFAQQATGSRWAGLLAALVVLASRPPFFNLAMGQLHGGTVGWVALGGALWWRARGNRIKLFFGGIFLGLALVESPYALLAVAGSCLALALAAGRRVALEPQTWRDQAIGLAVAAGGVLLLAFPQAFLLLSSHPSASEVLQTDAITFLPLGISIPVYDDLMHQLALWDFFNPLTAISFEPGARLVFLQAGAGMYAGLVGILLCLVAPKGRRWALVALVFMLTSLGSAIKVGPARILGPFALFNVLLAAIAEPLTMPDLFAIYAPLALSIGASYGAMRIAGKDARRWILLAGAVLTDALVAGGPSIETPATCIGADIDCIATVVSAHPGGVHYIGAKNSILGVQVQLPSEIEEADDGSEDVDRAERLRLSQIQGQGDNPAQTLGMPFLLQAYHHQPSTQTGLPPRWTFLGPTDPRVEALTRPGNPVYAWLSGERSTTREWTWDIPVRWVLVQDPDDTLGHGPLGPPVARCGDIKLFERPENGRTEIVAQGNAEETSRTSSQTSAVPPKSTTTSPGLASTRPSPRKGTRVTSGPRPVARAVPSGAEVASPSDRDNDGISDSKDRCPDVMELANGFWDDDGCPERDSDGDGFLDPTDACPKMAETVNNVWDQDGCPERDSDGDGIIDALDLCPRKAETINKIRDGDGCPERDSDGDGILDLLDRCRKTPETVNGLWDDDGCPEKDRDRDGIPDPLDACPKLPENINGLWDDDGCPESDPDHDGIFGNLDACPNQAETRNGLWDDDGCPERDRDHDGIIDPLDQCPRNKETWNGFWDQDGCPEKDRDHDGIPDRADACPDQKESRNGYDDQDGCPDVLPRARQTRSQQPWKNFRSDDRDGDGVPDFSDACPSGKENLNGWRDGDGCPEADTDLDGIPDVLDLCPKRPESRNGFWDDDGCPEADSDGDGIPVPWDRCPEKAENVNGVRDSDGCPEFDKDQDGILDFLDRCPDRPETSNGYRDSDGCPEEDSDNDGIIDARDRCPHQPETRNGFRDGDGCPEHDTDHDGILDILDKCPRKPEIRNGFRDGDGCPEFDKDEDGLVPPIDRCPNLAETANGFRDDDGCPERDQDHDRIPDAIDRCPTKAELPPPGGDAQGYDGCPDPGP